MLLAIAGPDGEYPRRINASGGRYVENNSQDGGETPDTYLTTIDYPSDYSIFLESTITNDTSMPDRIYGKYGTLELGGDPTLRADGDFAPEFKEKNDGYTEVRLSQQKGRDMEGNFIDVIRGRGTLYCNAELGAATMVGIGLGVRAYRQGKTIYWDPAREKTNQESRDEE
jgi:hypothetical protein